MADTETYFLSEAMTIEISSDGGLWITPIINRTAADVSYAKAHRDITTANKGALNFPDLNRIEIDCKYIADQLNAYGYNLTISVKTDWTMTDFPTLGHINRIRSNVDALLDAIYRLPGSPEIRYWNSLDWTDANALEQNLLNLYNLLQRMVSVFLRCGDAHGGDR